MPDGSSSDAPVMRPGPRTCSRARPPRARASSTVVRPAAGVPVAESPAIGLASAASDGSSTTSAILAIVRRIGSGFSSETALRFFATVAKRTRADLGARYWRHGHILAGPTVKRYRTLGVRSPASALEQRPVVTASCVVRTRNPIAAQPRPYRSGPTLSWAYCQDPQRTLPEATRIQRVKGAGIAVIPASLDHPRPLVVVAEDGVDALTMLGLMLEFRGFDVVLTGDGREALNAVILDGPDAVVSDMNMPHLDGLALCRAVRALPTGGGIPVILWSSAEVDDPRLLQANALGGVEFVSKSLAVTEVDAALRRLLALTETSGHQPAAEMGEDRNAQHRTSPSVGVAA